LNCSNLALGENPPVEVARAVVGKNEAQYEQVAAITVRYIPLNTTLPPFDDVNVRRAIVASFNRVRMRDARGGPFVGPVATHFLPPGCPGHEEAGGERGPGFDFLTRPRGDAALAASYMRLAGYSTGRYTGTTPIFLLASTDGPGRAQADAAAEELEKLGFPIDEVVVPNNEMYPEYCAVPGKRVKGQTIGVYGSAPNWQPEIIDPKAVLEPLFAGWTIRSNGNNNFAQLDDERINTAMKRAEELEGEERQRAWAEIDRVITAAAPGVPFVWERTTHLKSRNVHGPMNRYTSLWDLAHMYLQ
jgi:peptide/nickel transport system substrate-binding protein